MTARAIQKKHLINEFESRYDFRYKDSFSEYDLRKLLDYIYAPIPKVDHIRLLKNGDIEYGAISGGKAFHTIGYIYGVPVWNFLDTLPLSNFVNLVTDDTTDLNLYRSTINYLIDHGYKLEPSHSRGFAREAHFSFTKK